MKVAVLTVRGFMNSLKSTVTFALVVTWVAPFAGTVNVTVGGVVSAGGARRKAPNVVTRQGVARQIRDSGGDGCSEHVFGARALDGVNVAVTPE